MVVHLYPEEKILIKTRRHRYIFFSEIARFVSIITLLSAAGLVLLIFLPDVPYMPHLVSITLIVSALIFWTLGFMEWIDYYLDVWIVTTDRVLDIELLGFFRREVSEFKLSRVQDVTVNVHGFLATTINFGDVHIQTAGVSRQFVFRQVPKPHEVRRILIEAQDKYMERIAGRPLPARITPTAQIHKEKAS